ncbi:hypothetical protein [Streptomyces sp. NPDC058667]|uniref:hypothetical protein n=1 Tax=Streptomyces sp. NPDC058667 TaxID=3346588 RepID=UPI00364BA87B
MITPHAGRDDGLGTAVPDGVVAGPPGGIPPARPQAPAAPASAGAPPGGPAVPGIRPYIPGEGPREAPPSLGRSLALLDGDLVLDPHTHDLSLVVGGEALAQALELAVSTQTGSDRLNVRFGFDALALGAYAHDLPTRKEYITLELVRCLSSDRRVTDVREVFFDDDPRFVELGSGFDEQALRDVATAHADRRYTVYAVVDTIAGTALTLRARGTP